MKQTPLVFENAVDYSRESFHISPANAEAFAWIEKWPQWPSHCLVVHGPAGCGKTHLAHIWQQKTQALFLRDLDQANVPASPHACYILESAILGGGNERALLHLFNYLQEKNGFLLMTAREAPQRMEYRLPDLASRMKAALAIRIDQPDDALLETLMIKYFVDRQLRVGPDVRAFLLARMERSFAALHKIVEEIDKRALVEQRKVTVPFVRALLVPAAINGE